MIATILNTELPRHPFEDRMMPKTFSAFPATTTADLASITTLIKVYVDDFIGTIDTITKEHIRWVSRAMLHGIHSVSPPPDRHRAQRGGPHFGKEIGSIGRTMGLC